MKRIAQIRNSYSYDVGGAEIFPVNLAKLLESYGYEPLILSANKKTLAMASAAGLKAMRSPWWSFQNFSGIRVCLFLLYIFWQLYLCTWYVVWGVKHRIDIFQPQSRDDFIAATCAAKILRKKVIWTDHADLKHIYTNHTVWYKNPVGKLVYLAGKLADHVTLESSSEARLIEASLGKRLPSNYSVIHIGVVDVYKPARRKPSKIVLVATSRLVKEKGIGELIEAFRLLDNENVVLKLCGDGPDGNYFKSIAKDVSGIEFLGHVDDIGSILQNADILVHPTYHEGFGLSLVEAEMWSLPIIASNVGSIPEIVKDGISGILVRPGKAEDLVRAIRSLVDNKRLRVRMGRAGRQIYLGSFQFDMIVENRFLPLYESQS